MERSLYLGMLLPQTPPGHPADGTPSGILPICDTEDGLAVVLGHEIAHNVAHHAAERLSQVVWVAIGMWGLAFLLGSPDFLSQILIDFGFTRPGSRKQEVRPMPPITILNSGGLTASSQR